jgi:hypothetical protein
MLESQAGGAECMQRERLFFRFQRGLERANVNPPRHP